MKMPSINMPQNDVDKRIEMSENYKRLRQYGSYWRHLAYLLSNFDKWKVLTNQDIKHIEENNRLMRLEIAKWNFDYVIENSLGAGSKLDAETAYMLYETWHGERVWDNIDRFILDVRVFDKVIYTHFLCKSSNEVNFMKLDDFLEKNIKRFENQSDIVIYLLNHRVELFKIRLYNFSWLNKIVAETIWYERLLSLNYTFYDDLEEEKFKNIFKRLDEESLRGYLKYTTLSIFACQTVVNQSLKYMVAAQTQYYKVNNFLISCYEKNPNFKPAIA